MFDVNRLKTTAEEIIAISNIAKRYIAESHTRRELIDVIICIEVANCTCPLNLNGLLKSDTKDLLHDVSRIISFLDYETGELTKGFVPRYAKK